MLIFLLTCLVPCAYAATGDKNQAVLNLYQQDFNGDGTYYGNTIQGTCSYGTPLPTAATDSRIKALVALNSPQFLNSVTCGICLRVVGSGSGLGSNPIKGEYIVFVKDLCPECQAGDVDFALDGDGRWDINIQAVQCPVGNSKIQYSFQGSNQWYLKLQVRNARIPITTLEIQNNGQWKTPTHSSDGYWVLSDGQGFPQSNIHVRLTAANGQVLEDIVPRLENDSVMEGLNHVQISQDSTLPSI